ncbi:MAG: histidine kinase [Clostridiales bacterium]|nr:histidine kinase [Clostridiales bacterium]
MHVKIPRLLLVLLSMLFVFMIVLFLRALMEPSAGIQGSGLHEPDFFIFDFGHMARTALTCDHLADMVIGGLSIIIGLMMFVTVLYMGHLQLKGMAPYAYLSIFITAGGSWLVSGSPVISLIIPSKAITEILYTISISTIIILLLLYVFTWFSSRLKKVLLEQTVCKVLAPLPILFLGTLTDLINTILNIYSHGAGYKLAFLVFTTLLLIRILQTIRECAARSHRYTQMEKDLLQSRTSVMLSQIKPHFLNNVLNSISALCMTDPEKAEAAIDTFSRFLRENIQALESQKPIPFRQELEHIRNYMRIEQMRFGDRLHIAYDIGFADFQVPALCLQTLIENAVRHGVGRNPQGGTISLRTERQGSYAVVVITDDGAGFDPSAPSRGIGLANAKLLLELMAHAQMNLTSAPSQGTTVTIRIPLMQEDNT